MIYRSPPVKESKENKESKKNKEKKEIKEKKTTKAPGSKTSKTKPKLRPSPTNSATIFPAGTIKVGNDGKDWEVGVDKKGVKRWKKLKEDNSGLVTKFTIGKINSSRIKFLSKLMMSGPMIGAGEILYSIYPAKKGEYNIYRIYNSLIALYHTEKIEKLGKMEFKYVGNAMSDIGSFAFIDAKRMFQYVKKTNKSLGYTVPTFSSKVFRTKDKKQKEWWEIYEKDLESERKNINADDITPLAVMLSNGVGDGVAPIYRSGVNYLIMDVVLYESIKSK